MGKIGKALGKMDPRSRLLNPKNVNDLAEIYRRMLTGEYKFVGRIGKLRIPPESLKIEILKALEKDIRAQVRKAGKKGKRIVADDYLEETRNSPALLKIYEEIGLDLSIIETLIKDIDEGWNIKAV